MNIYHNLPRGPDYNCWSQLFCHLHNLINFMTLQVGYRLVPWFNWINFLSLHVGQQFHSLLYSMSLVWFILIFFIFLQSLQYVAFIAYGSLYNATGHGLAATFEHLQSWGVWRRFRKPYPKRSRKMQLTENTGLMWQRSAWKIMCCKNLKYHNAKFNCPCSHFD